MNAIAPAAGHSDTIDLFDAARAIRRGWRHVLGWLVFSVLAAAAIVLWAPKHYKSPASVIIRQSDLGGSLLSKIVGQNGGGDMGGMMSSVGKGSLETEIAILNSRALAEQVIDSLHLTFYSRGRLLARPDAITAFLKRIDVEKVGGDVVGVTYSAKDSLSAATIPNTVVALYLARRKTTDRGVNAHRVEFLRDRLDSAAANLTAVETQLRREQEASGVLDPVISGRLELEQAGDVRAQVTQLEIESAALDQLISQVKSGTMTARQIAAFPSFIKSNSISPMLSQLSDLDAQRLKLLATRTEADPDVEAIDLAIKSVEAQLMPIAVSYATSVAKQKKDMHAELDTLQAAIMGLPRSAQANGRLQRDVLRYGQIYAALQAQLVEASLAAIGEGGDVHQLDFAEPPLHPSFPQPLLTMGIGAAAGVVLGIFAALLSGGIGRWARDPLEVERVAGIPALTFDATSPLLIAPLASTRTILVLPLDMMTRTDAVAQQLAATASARAITTTVLDLSGAAGVDANAKIEQLEREFGSVIVQLPPLSSQTAAGALRDGRPVVLVASTSRVDKAVLSNALGTLKRLDIPCAGIVLNPVHTNGKGSPFRLAQRDN